MTEFMGLLYSAVFGNKGTASYLFFTNKMYNMAFKVLLFNKK